MIPDPAQSPELSDPAPQPAAFHREVRAWARDLLLALCFAFVIIVFLYQPVKVEGTSMAPLISDQERIFINKFVYRFEPIERGDVVVFWYPLDRSKSFIKRVVGLPGDMVEIREGRVYVNGISLPSRICCRAIWMTEVLARFAYPRRIFCDGRPSRSVQMIRAFSGRCRERFIYGKAVFAYWPVDHFGSISASAAHRCNNLFRNTGGLR